MPTPRAAEAAACRQPLPTAPRAEVEQVIQGRPLADGFLTDLKDAVRDRRPFNPRTGLPGAGTAGGEPVTWYTHARSYAEGKWPNLAPVSRRSLAEALVTVTVALDRLHGALLDAAREGLLRARAVDLSATVVTAWWEMPEQNRYLRDHLIEHLLAAGHSDEAEQLATDLRWTASRLKASGPAAHAQMSR